MDIREQIAKIINNNITFTNQSFGDSGNIPIMDIDVEKTAMEILTSLASTPDEALRETIAQVYCQFCSDDPCEFLELCNERKTISDQILSLIQTRESARVELAKRERDREIDDIIASLCNANCKYHLEECVNCYVEETVREVEAKYTGGNNEQTETNHL